MYEEKVLIKQLRSGHVISHMEHLKIYGDRTSSFIHFHWPNLLNIILPSFAELMSDSNVLALNCEYIENISFLPHLHPVQMYKPLNKVKTDSLKSAKFLKTWILFLILKNCTYSLILLNQYLTNEYSPILISWILLNKVQY